MATEYTPNFQLPKYASADAPNLRDQYNEAMDTIDAQLLIVTDATDTASKAAQKNAADISTLKTKVTDNDQMIGDANDHINELTGEVSDIKQMFPVSVANGGTGFTTQAALDAYIKSLAGGGANVSFGYAWNPSFLTGASSVQYFNNGYSYGDAVSYADGKFTVNLPAGANGYVGLALWCLESVSNNSGWTADSYVSMYDGGSGVIHDNIGQARVKYINYGPNTGVTAIFGTSTGAQLQPRIYAHGTTAGTFRASVSFIVLTY